MAIGTILGITGAVTAAAGAAGSIISAAGQASLNKETMKFNREEAEKAREFNAEEAEKAREFNAEQAAITRDYYSEQSVMERRSEAGLNSAVVGQPGSTSSGGPSATGPAATGPAANVSGMVAPDYGRAIVDTLGALEKVVDISGKFHDNKSKEIHNNADAEFLSQDRQAALSKSLAETQEIIQNSVSKQLENDFTFQSFNQRLELLAKSVTSADLENGIKELNQFDIKNKIQNGVEQAYYLWVENNTKMFNTLLNAENFEHQWEQDRNQIRLAIEQFKKDYTDMSYRYGRNKSVYTPSLTTEHQSLSEGRSVVKGVNSSLGSQSSQRNYYTSSNEFSSDNLSGNLGSNKEFSHDNGYTHSFGHSETQQGETFVNSRLGEMAVSVEALWDIVDDSSVDVRTRKSALNDLRKTLGDIESYGRFQVMIRELRGKAFAGSDTLQVQ